MPELQHLSYSSISSYLYCARAWRYHYLDKIETPTSPELVLGSAFHGAIEDYLTARTVAREADLTTSWAASWTKQTEGKDIDWGADTPERFHNDGLRLIDSAPVRELVDGLRVAVDDQGPKIERKVELRVPGVPIPIIGYIDLVAHDGVPCDLKTSARAWTSDRAQSELQSLFYLAALNQAGDNSHRWTFRHLVFVKTKTPQVQILEHSHRPGEVLWMFSMIRDIWNAIDGGHFPCNPTGWKCSPNFCDYWARCRGKYI